MIIMEAFPVRDVVVVNPTRYVLPVFIQNKWSRINSTKTTLSISDVIISAFNHRKLFLKIKISIQTGYKKYQKIELV